MKRLLLILVLLLVTAIPTLPKTPSKQACVSVVTHQVVDVVFTFGIISIVETTTTTCCYDDGQMSCTSVVTYEF